MRTSDDIEEVKRLQRGHGGFNLLMIPVRNYNLWLGGDTIWLKIFALRCKSFLYRQILGERGTVLGTDRDGDVKVKFGPLNRTLNPAILTKETVEKQPERGGGITSKSLECES